jgi:hypothetical protein
MEKVFTNKGIVLFLVTGILFSLTNHVKSDYISYIGLNKIEGLINLGPIMLKKKFVFGIVLSIVLSLFHLGFSSTGLIETIIQLN